LVDGRGADDDDDDDDDDDVLAMMMMIVAPNPLLRYSFPSPPSMGSQMAPMINQA